MYRLPNETPKCREWKDAFKGEGSYYTLMNLIKFHGCRVPGVKGNMMSLNDSLADVESAVEQYRGLYYKLFAYMKRVIEANNFDFNKRMKELYPKKICINRKYVRLNIDLSLSVWYNNNIKKTERTFAYTGRLG